MRKLELFSSYKLGKQCNLRNKIFPKHKLMGLETLFLIDK